MRPAMGAAWDRLSPRQKSWAMAGTVALISLAAGYGLSQLGEGQGGPSNAGGSATECEDVLYWYDPMVPGQHFDEPGKSPFMDMQLVPKCAPSLRANERLQLVQHVVMCAIQGGSARARRGA